MDAALEVGPAAAVPDLKTLCRPTTGDVECSLSVGTRLSLREAVEHVQRLRLRDAPLLLAPPTRLPPCPQQLKPAGHLLPFHRREPEVAGAFHGREVAETT